MTEYGLGAGAAAKAGGGLRRAGQAVGSSLGRVSQTARSAAARSSNAPARRAAPPPNAAQREAPGALRLEASPSGAVVLFEQWSGPDDPLEEVPQAPEELIAAVEEPAPTVEPPAPAAETGALDRDLVGATTDEAVELLGKPVLAFTGLGPNGADAHYVFAAAGGRRISVLVRDGIVVGASEAGR